MVALGDIDWKKVIVLLSLLVILFSLIIVTYTKNCGNDETCFNERASSCSRAIASFNLEGNTQQFKIIGSHGETCRITTTLIEPNKDFHPTVQEYLKGKGMVCEIPKQELKEKTLKEIEGLNDFCSGPLKEAILQISVDNLYNIVVKNFGQKALQEYSQQYNT